MPQRFPMLHSLCVKPLHIKDGIAYDAAVVKDYVSRLK